MRDGGWRRRRTLVVGAVLVALLAVAGTVVGLLRPDSDGTAAPAAAAPDAPCPDHVGGGPLTSTFTTAPEGCYGFTDAGPGFGKQQQILDLQAQIFAANAGVARPDLTVVWLGSLTCTDYRPDGACGNGLVYEAERQELQALLVAQKSATAGHSVRVVLANAGPGMKHAERVARLIAERREAFGRVVVIGGGESRQETRNGFQTLLAAGLPVIAPVLSSDLAAPGRPFLDQPGFLQLSLPNKQFSTDIVNFVAAHTAAGTRREVIVYHAPDAGDEYTGSYALDVVAAAQAGPRTRVSDQPVVSSIDKIPPRVCRSSTPDAGTTELPAALFFADRWSSFKQFAQAITTLCGDAGPAMLITSDSVSRIMANDDMRSQINAPYPMAYIRKGKQCSELEAMARANPAGQAAPLLTAVRTHLGACQPGPDARQLGGRVPMFWDAVALAFGTVPAQQTFPAAGAAGAAGTSAGTSGGTVDPAAAPQVANTTLAGSTGALEVRGGQMVGHSDSAQMLCVFTVDVTRAGGRSQANCDAIYGPVVP